jgi:conjugal transfer pilin signal peptidase TrbI
MRGHVALSVVFVLAGLPLLLVVLRASRRVYLLVTCIAGGSVAAALVGLSASGYRISENITESLGGHLYVHREGEPFQRGDLVAFRWRGGATYPAGSIFIKRVLGVPGDEVWREGDSFWVGGQYVGQAKPFTSSGTPLTAAPEGVIELGQYFVATPSPNSLDSRYAIVGNIRQAEIIGRAHELF